MPRILITGNGFDLHHKLPTKYNDFINIVKHIAEQSEIDFESIFKNVDSYKIIKETFNNEIEFNEERIAEIRELANKNQLFNFFKSEFEIETWIDFENKIEYLLSNTFHGIKIFRENVVSAGPMRQNALYSMKHLNNQIVYAQILEFLEIIEMGNQQFFMNENYLISKYGYIIDVDEEKIIEKIYSQLIEFRKLFNLYLQTFVVPLYDNFIVEKPLSNIFNNIDYYFTFNYTPTFERLYNNSKITANYLHGKSELNKENIVFGINEVFSEESNKNIYIKFTKYFQKFNNRTDFYFLNKINESKDENFVFYFWGHSLDKSDSNYINEVFDFIDNAKSKIKRIVVIYHSENSRTKSILNLLNIRSKDDIEAKIRNNTLIFCRNDSEELRTDLTENIIKPPIAMFF